VDEQQHLHTLWCQLDVLVSDQHIQLAPVVTVQVARHTEELFAVKDVVGIHK